MSFWSVEVKPGEKSRPLRPELDGCFHLSHAVLRESEGKEDDGFIDFYVTFGDEEVLLGTLSSKRDTKINFKTAFHQKFELSHSSKDSTVYFYGFRDSFIGEYPISTFDSPDIRLDEKERVEEIDQSSAYWSAEVKPNSSCLFKCEKDAHIHLCLATRDPTCHPEEELIYLYVEVTGWYKKPILATLPKGCGQILLDLVVDGEFSLSHTSQHSVYFVGTNTAKPGGSNLEFGIKSDKQDILENVDGTYSEIGIKSYEQDVPQNAAGSNIESGIQSDKQEVPQNVDGIKSDKQEVPQNAKGKVWWLKSSTYHYIGKVEPGGFRLFIVDFANVIRLTHASLQSYEGNKVMDNEDVLIYVEVGGAEKSVIGTLSRECPQIRFDLSFTSAFTLSHSSKDATVCFWASQVIYPLEGPEDEDGCWDWRLGPPYEDEPVVKQEEGEHREADILEEDNPATAKEATKVEAAIV